MRKKRWRDMCFPSFWLYDLCRVLNNAELTIAPGHIMLGGCTRNFLNKPARPIPMSWEEMQSMTS